MSDRPGHEAPMGSRGSRLPRYVGPNWMVVPVLTFGTTLWLQVLHGLEGDHETNEPGVLLHWLRDGTLALPLVTMGVLAALWVSGRLLRRRRPAPGSVVPVLVTSAIVALGASAALGLGSPAHEWLFGGHEHHELPPALHALRDSLVGLPVAVWLASVLAAMTAVIAKRSVAGHLPRRPEPSSRAGGYSKDGRKDLEAAFGDIPGRAGAGT